MFDTFISYRRAGGSAIAPRIYDYLRLKSYSPFYDINGMEAGRFDEQILFNIRNAQNFLLILSKGALDRCVNEDDWVRQEIATAIEFNLNIVVFIEEGFVYPDNLPDEIRVIKQYQAIEYSEISLSSRIEMLPAMLKYSANLVGVADYGKKIKSNKIKISGEYMTSYEDYENERLVIKKAPAVLKQMGNRIWGKTWFGSEQEWKIKGRLYKNKRIAGIYYAKGCLDEGFGTFFLEIRSGNVYDGYWSGYDNANRKITTGHYIFKKKYTEYKIREGKSSDFPAIIRIANKQLGDDYMSKETLQGCIDKDSDKMLLVAVDDDSDSVIGFSICDLIDYDQLKKICFGKELKELMFEEKIGYIQTVAVMPQYNGLGVATEMIGESIKELKKRDVNCMVSTAWKHAGIINIEAILKKFNFTPVVEIPKYWYESSLKYGFKCPQCGNPCYCSCVVFTKI